METLTRFYCKDKEGICKGVLPAGDQQVQGIVYQLYPLRNSSTGTSSRCGILPFAKRFFILFPSLYLFFPSKAWKARLL